MVTRYENVPPNCWEDNANLPRSTTWLQLAFAQFLSFSKKCVAEKQKVQTFFVLLYNYSLGEIYFYHNQNCVSRR